MVTSKSDTNIKKRKPRRKRLSLHLLNDTTHSFEYVIDVLTTLMPSCNKLRAEQIAMIVHNTGEAQIYSGFPPEIYLIYARFKGVKLNVQIREYTNKNRKS